MKVDSIKNQICNSEQPILRKGELVTNVQFNGKNDSSQNEEKKSGFSVKKATNVAAVLMWLAIVGAGIYRTGLFQKRNPENIEVCHGSKTHIGHNFSTAYKSRLCFRNTN